MAKTNQITLGRLQILRYLMNCPGWVFTTEVLNNVKPDGITTLHGVRKALNELECVEMENITPAGRPNYQCRMKTNPETFNILLNEFVGTEYQDEFLNSKYCEVMTCAWHSSPALGNGVWVHNPAMLLMDATPEEKVALAYTQAIVDQVVMRNMSTLLALLKRFYPPHPLIVDLDIYLKAEEISQLHTQTMSLKTVIDTRIAAQPSDTPL